MNFQLLLYKYRFLAYAILVVGMTMLFTCMLVLHSEDVTQKNSNPSTTNAATEYSGEANQISNYLYQGQYIPGFSPQETPVPTQPTRQPPINAINRAKIYLINNLEESGSEIAVDSLTLVATTKTVWLDNQVGCAYPGEITLADNVPGWIIVIKYPSNNKNYVFHANDSGTRLRLCQVMDTWVN